MARREGNNLSTRANWVALVVEHVFVANGTSDYLLPPDFRSLIGNTMWDRSRFWRMRGAMTPQQWQMYKSSIIGRATIERRWRLRIPSGKTAGSVAQFEIDPPITDTSAIFVYEYVSDNWCRSATLLSAEGAVPDAPGVGYRIGDTLILSGGTFSTSAVGVVTAYANSTLGSIGTLEIVTPGVYTVPPSNPVAVSGGMGSGATFTVSFLGATQPDWVADSDTALLDEDLMELGVLWRTMRRIGIAYDEEQSEYENQVRQSIARDGGTANLNLAPRIGVALVGPYNVQEGNFPG